MPLRKISDVSRRGGKYQEFTLWESGLNEVQLMVPIKTHIETQLKANGIKMESGGYKLADVHTKNTLLSLTIGATTVRGTTDFVLVPFDTDDLVFSGQARVLFEIKSPKNIEEKSTDLGHPQAVAELIAAFGASNFVPMLVLTDLARNWHIYRAGKEEEIVHIICATGAQAMANVRDYLSSDNKALLSRTKDARVPRYVNRMVASHFKELGKKSGGLGEQLDILECLPAEERLAASFDIAQSWVGMYA